MDLKRRKMDSEDMVLSAVKVGNLHQLKEILDKKSREEISTLVSVRKRGRTPLIIACKNGHQNVARYLVESCNADINQVGSMTLGGIVTDGAFPLWCAAAGGHFNIVKMLVEHNAPANSTTEENNTALQIACYEGYFKIAKYLIQHGADIEIAELNGTTCLMAAFNQKHYKISKYLLKRGADVNRKTLEGNTVLHDCATSGNLKILKMVLQCGAKNYPNCHGTTPVNAAAIEGNSRCVQYFINEFNLTKQEKINALELLGSYFIDEDTAETLDCWTAAMMLRHEDGKSPLEKPSTRSPIASCIDATEVRTLHQLEELLTPDEMFIQALLIMERILGPRHPNTFRYIGLSHRLYRSNNAYFHRCMKLWMYALDEEEKFLDTFNSRTMTLLSCFVDIFSCMMEEYRPLEENLSPVSFQNILYVFKQSLRKIERDLYVLTSEKRKFETYQFHNTLEIAIHLIGLMCRLQPHLNVDENAELKTAVCELVHLNPKGRNDFSPLHLACCREFPLLIHHFCLIEFPSPEVVDLLLEVGASPNAVDAANNTPLHVAAMNMPCAPEIFKALVNYGAHLDSCNYERKTPLQLANIKPLFDDNPMRYIKLQCLCAKVIRKYEIPYEGFVPKKFKEFLDSH